MIIDLPLPWTGGHLHNWCKKFVPLLISWAGSQVDPFFFLKKINFYTGAVHYGYKSRPLPGQLFCMETHRGLTDNNTEPHLHLFHPSKGNNDLQCDLGHWMLATPTLHSTTPNYYPKPYSPEV